MPAQNEKAAPRKVRLLVADDCDSARALVEIALCDEDDFNLCFVADGLTAIEKCQQQMPDIAILDMQMPGASGIEVCQWIKQNSGSSFVPVIIVTSQTDVNDRVNGLNCGADDYIVKPFALPELKARVSAFLRIKELTNHLQKTRTELEEKGKELVAVQVAGAAAHELGQPLTAMLLNCELLGRVPREGELFQQTLSAIQEQCAQMRDILTKLNRLEQFKTKNYLCLLYTSPSPRD